MPPVSRVLEEDDLLRINLVSLDPNQVLRGRVPLVHKKELFILMSVDLVLARLHFKVSEGERSLC